MDKFRFGVTKSWCVRCKKEYYSKDYNSPICVQCKMKEKSANKVKPKLIEYRITAKLVSPIVMIVHASSEAEAERLARSKQGMITERGQDEIFIQGIEESSFAKASGDKSE